tara:strand:- start:1050 stop:1856 length:807 start_codon:yes stop_codon:yes gene_type:complete
MLDKILLFIPAYCCEIQIARVLGKFTPDMKNIFTEVLVIDNRSTDKTVQNAIAAAKEVSKNTNINVKVIRNKENISLGGTHKVAFNYAIEKGFDYVCILHGDDQGNIEDLIKAIKTSRHKNLDYYLGGRFLPESKLNGYSNWRILGNKFFNLIFSFVVKRKLYDLGAGVNIFSVKDLSTRFYLTFPNRLTFNYYFILYLCAYKKRFEYFPHTWVEEDQVSNLKLFKSVSEILLLIGKYTIHGKNLFKGLHQDQLNYETEKLYDSADKT